MPQPKGHTGNPNGRPKGKPNRITSEAKVWIQQLIDKNRSMLEKDLLKMDAKERWTIIEKLMAYVIPKMSTGSIDANLNLLGKLSEEDFNRLIVELSKNMNHESED